MGEDSKENSWYEFLETCLDENSLSSPDNVRALSSLFGKHCPPEIQIWLLRYECTLCMKTILELRMGKCNHDYCSACVPRLNCSLACKLTMLNTISSGDKKSQEKIIKDFQASGRFHDNLPRSNKRKERDEDGDEMAEYLARLN